MTSSNKETPNLITKYINKASSLGSQKHLSSAVSPVEMEHQNKKANMDEKVSLSARMAMEDVNLGNLKNLLVPLTEKVDQLRESVDYKYS